MNTLRTALLNNVTQMLEYAEKELKDVTKLFRYEYAAGFVYGHKCDKIVFEYNPLTKTARVQVNHYSSAIYVWKNHITLDYERKKDFTDRFLNNSGRSESEDALLATQQNWSGIKSAIARHKSMESDVYNFHI